MIIIPLEEFLPQQQSGNETLVPTKTLPRAPLPESKEASGKRNHVRRRQRKFLHKFSSPTHQILNKTHFFP
jgi:hypothetical protein